MSIIFSFVVFLNYSVTFIKFFLIKVSNFICFIADIFFVLFDQVHRYLKFWQQFISLGLFWWGVINCSYASQARFLIYLWVRFEHATFRSRRGHQLICGDTVVIVGSQSQYDTYNKYIKFIITETLPCVVGPCHHGMARPQVADRGTASNMEGSCE